MENDKLTFREGIELSHTLMYELLDKQRELTVCNIIDCVQEIFNELKDNYDELRNEELRKHLNIDKNWSSKYLKEKIDPVIKVLK